jgi:hypothetical protein
MVIGKGGGPGDEGLTGVGLELGLWVGLIWMGGLGLIWMGLLGLAVAVLDCLELGVFDPGVLDRLPLKLTQRHLQHLPAYSIVKSDILALMAVFYCHCLGDRLFQ